jgi:23S rRNA (guanosine2251-2'-O)-methyltransferase
LDLVRVVNLPRALGELKKSGFWVVGAEASAAEPLDGFEFPERCVLVVGSEGGGLGREVARQADLGVRIDLAADSPVDSLNVSCAGAILMRARTAK